MQADTQATIDAVSAPRSRRLGIRQTTGYYLAFLALGLGTASLGPTLPALAENTGSLLSEVSFLFTAGALGYMVGSLLGGRLFDRLAGHPVMFTDLVTVIAMMTLIPLLSELWILTAALTIMGVGKGMLDVGGNTLLVWVHRDRVGPFMNGLHFFFGVGSFLSPIIIAQAVDLSGGIYWAYWVLALLMVPVAVWMILQPSPASPAGNPGPAPTPEVEAEAAHPARTKPAGVFLLPLVMFFYFLYVGAEVSFGGWIFTYTTTLGLSQAASAAYLTSAFWGGITLGRLLSIPIALRFEPIRVLFFDLLGCLGFAGVILIWPGNLVAVWVGAIGLGLAMASIFPTMLALAEQQMPITGRVTGWFFVGASAGGMFLPWLIGQLFVSLGPRTMIYAIGIDLAVALVVFGAIFALTRSGADHLEAKAGLSSPH